MTFLFFLFVSVASEPKRNPRKHTTRTGVRATKKALLLEANEWEVCTTTNDDNTTNDANTTNDDNTTTSTNDNTTTITNDDDNTTNDDKLLLLLMMITQLGTKKSHDCGKS